MKLKLPASVSSVQDLTNLLLEVREYAKWFSHNEIKKRSGAKTNHDSPSISADALEVIDAWAAKKPLNRQSLDELIETLDEYRSNAPAMSITLAAPATNDIRKVLVNWCRDNVAPNVMVTFKFNSSILGGMVIRYGSRMFDWSFRRQIMDNRAKFPEVLRRV